MDDWHDWFRVINAIICFISLCLLGRRFAKRGSAWTAKTRDYWYAVVMWNVAGLAMSIEGIVRDSSMGSRLPFIFAAAIVTLIGLLRRGEWGDAS